MRTASLLPFVNVMDSDRTRSGFTCKPALRPPPVTVSSVPLRAAPLTGSGAVPVRPSRPRFSGAVIHAQQERRS